MGALTLIHVVISLIGIVTGLVVVFGFLKPTKPGLMNTTFLAFTILTDITGFIFFPFHGNTPAIDLGIISLIVLAIALLALKRKMTTAYIIAAILAEFFNVFVLIVQSFQKIPALHQLAPKGNEPVVGVTQLVVLVGFLVLAVIAIRKKAYVLA
jgi:hypothetical protein